MSKIELNIVSGSLLCAFCSARTTAAIRVVTLTGNQRILCFECAGAVSLFHAKSFGNSTTETEQDK